MTYIREIYGNKYKYKSVREGNKVKSVYVGKVSARETNLLNYCWGCNTYRGRRGFCSVKCIDEYQDNQDKVNELNYRAGCL